MSSSDWAAKIITSGRLMSRHASNCFYRKERSEHNNYTLLSSNWFVVSKTNHTFT